MTALSEILRSFFKGDEIKPTVVTVETALHPAHEKDVYQGAEFLDDHIRTDDPEEDEMNRQIPQ